MDIDALRMVMADNQGLFTRRQARDCGFSDSQIRTRLRSGDWQRVLGTVLAPGGVRLTPWVRDAAALLAVPGSVRCGPSAARFHGLGQLGSGTWLVVPRDYHSRLTGVRFLREPLPPDDLECTDGMLVTSKQRAVFDCLRVLPEPSAAALLDRALLLRWTTFEDLSVRVRAHLGRRGAPRVVRLLRRVAEGSRSAAERRLLPLLRRAGLTGWIANHPVVQGGSMIGVVDVGFPDRRVAVEVDGWAYHHQPERFRADRRRQNRLVAAGWTVLRFTWHDLTERPDEVIRTVTALLARRAG